MPTKKPSQWTAPPNLDQIEAAVAKAIDLQKKLDALTKVDEQGLRPQDKQTHWDGLTNAQADLFQRLVASFMTKYLPHDTDWSTAIFIATNRPTDPTRAIDFLSASTIPWDPVDLIQEWLDDQE